MNLIFFHTVIAKFFGCHGNQGDYVLNINLKYFHIAELYQSYLIAMVTVFP